MVLLASHTERVVLYVAMTTLLFLMIHGKLLRKQRHFFAAMTRVHSSSKMLPEYVLQEFVELSKADCVMKCIGDARCEAINYHYDKEICRTLNSTTLATKNTLEKVQGWTVYETDPGTRNNGVYCETNSPCLPTHICDDTFDPIQPFICRCQEDFAGNHCQNHTGPGSSKRSPAGSCSLISARYENLANGFYWLRRKRKVSRFFCDMKHAEAPGKSAMSAIRSCKWLKKKYPDSKGGEYWSVTADGNKKLVKCKMESAQPARKTTTTTVPTTEAAPATSTSTTSSKTAASTSPPTTTTEKQAQPATTITTTTAPPSTSTPSTTIKTTSVTKDLGLNGDSRCTFVIGDGRGRGEVNMGNLKGIACIDACIAKRKTEISITGISVYSDTTKDGCWCEKSMESRHTKRTDKKSCFLAFNACTFIIGDGTGGTEVNMGTMDRISCVNACIEKRKSKRTITGVTIDPRRNGCWCEYSMRRIDTNDKTYMSCFLDFKSP